MSHACQRFLKLLRNPNVLLTFDDVYNPLRLPRKTTSERPKVARTCGVFYILTSKCASRHNNVHFFDISTSKSGPSMVCFVHFGLETCFAPQQRALFRHLNFKKCSKPGAFSTFWLRNVLRATTACNFLSLIRPAGSAPAALASLLFDPPEPQTIGKTQCFATFLPFRAPGSSFFWDFLFFDLLSSSLLTSLCPYCRKFDYVWLPNFLRWSSCFKHQRCYAQRSSLQVSNISHATLWRSEKRKSEKKENAGAPKSKKSRTAVFSAGLWLWMVRGHLARWEMKKCTLLWREARYNCNYPYIALHNHTTTTTILLYTTIHLATLHYATIQYTTLQYIAIHYTNYTTPQLQLQLRYSYYTTLQWELTTTTPLNYNYSYTYNCTTPYYIQQLWRGDRCNHCNHSRKHKSNQPFL